MTWRRSRLAAIGDAEHTRADDVCKAVDGQSKRAFGGVSAPGGAVRMSEEGAEAVRGGGCIKAGTSRINSPSALRHTFASMESDSGQIETMALARLMGHSTTHTLSRYVSNTLASHLGSGQSGGRPAEAVGGVRPSSLRLPVPCKYSNVLMLLPFLTPCKHPVQDRIGSSRDTQC
jgi:hypothetical protein